MRFLCDQMLMGLGRWLRVAGYDTIIIRSSLADEVIYIMAKSDNRLLLTRDHHFVVMKGANETVCYLSSNTLEACVLEVTKKLKISWLHKPFSRCLVCNSLFRETQEPEHLRLVPEDVKHEAHHISFCDTCQKVFWQGSHTEHMLQKLTDWEKQTH